jgi:hypothetical protein
MSTDHIVSLLIAERDRLSAAIAALSGSVKRRGRPAKTNFGTAPTPQKKTTGWSPAQKAAQAKRMKAFWAKKNRTSQA